MSIFSKKGSRLDTPEGARKFRNKLAETFATTSKQIVWVFTINGILWIWCSYILAFRGAYQIAETLSSAVCNIVIGQLGFYLVTSTTENIFKYNSFHGHIVSKNLKDGINIPTQEDLNNEHFTASSTDDGHCDDPDNGEESVLRDLASAAPDGD